MHSAIAELQHTLPSSVEFLVLMSHFLLPVCITSSLCLCLTSSCIMTALICLASYWPVSFGIQSLLTATAIVNWLGLQGVMFSLHSALSQLQQTRHILVNAMRSAPEHAAWSSMLAYLTSPI